MAEKQRKPRTISKFAQAQINYEKFRDESSESDDDLQKLHRYKRKKKRDKEWEEQIKEMNLDGCYDNAKSFNCKCGPY